PRPPSNRRGKAPSLHWRSPGFCTILVRRVRHPGARRLRPVQPAPFTVKHPAVGAAHAGLAREMLAS
ncbi:hypothetical protein, partial [Acidithiobacillus ferriphilus]|uniref:hypothetical protein n=1 Tax=Acidithiobacillus ferriphilus TaxID=1689834 RepID=UPI002DB55FE7